MQSFQVASVVAILSLMAAAIGHAQQTAGSAVAEEVNIDNVVVTASRFDESAAQQVIGTQVVSAEQIRASGARTLPEFLAQRAGIYTRDNTGSPNQQLDLRGFGITGDQNTLVLVDGQRISENEQVPADLASIPIESIERVEIVRGSGSVLYGGGATGGTINIITRGAARQKQSATFEAGYGTYETAQLAAAASVGGDRAGFSVYANHTGSDNYRDNNELQQRSFQSDLRLFGRRGPVYLKLGTGDQDLRLPGSRTEQQLITDRRGTATPNDYSTLRTSRANLGTRLLFDGIEVDIDLTHRERDSFAVNQPGLIDISGRDTAFSPRVRVPFVFGVAHQLIVGVDWDQWEYETTSEFPPFSPSAISSSQTNNGVYLKDSMYFDTGTRISIGARAHRVDTSIRDQTGASPEQSQKRDLEAWELALRQNVGSAVALYIKGGKSFRVANVDDNRFLAEPLEPQISHDAEIGADIVAGPVIARLAVYQMDLENEISFLPSDVLPPFGGNVNLPPTERNGVELEAQWNAARWLIVSGQYTYAEARYREGSFGGTDISGNDIPLVPRHRAGVSASVLPIPQLRITATVNYVGEQRYDNDQSNTFGRLMPAYTLTDLTASYRLQRWTLRAIVSNLFNELYYSYAIASTVSPTFNAYPAAERSVLVKAQYRF